MKNPIKTWLEKRKQAKFEKARQNILTELSNAQQVSQSCRLTCQALSGQVERTNNLLDINRDT